MRQLRCNAALYEWSDRMGTYRLRLVDTALVIVAVLLTLATGYIHYWVGGVLLTLNAAGYLSLAIATLGSALLFRRGLPLVLIAVALYAAVTIVAWLVMGPYFDVAYVAKGIELVLISSVAVWLRRNRSWSRES